MKRKKQDVKLAFLGRHRNKRRAGSKGRSIPIKAENQATEEAEQPPSEAATPGRFNNAKYLVFDPLNPMPRAAYKTIPLHDGHEPRTEEVPRDSGQNGSTPAGAIPSTDWLGLGSGVRSREERGTPSSSASESSEDGHAGGPQPAGQAEASTSDRDSLEKLDSVIHDFVASMDQVTSSEPRDGASSADAERFLRLLEHSPSNGPVLGPAVFFGASPHVGLESALGLLGSLRKTGILRVQADDVTFMVSIVRGDVVHGVSYPRPASELLGNILVSRGTIDAERLGRFFEEHGSSTFKIGEALNQQALVSTDELKETLEHQLRLLFDRLLVTRESVWCFHEGEATLAYINMRMNVIGVLLESARKNDERPAAGRE